MATGRTPKTIAYKTPDYKREKGRLRKRWREAVLVDMRKNYKLGIKG